MVGSEAVVDKESAVKNDGIPGSNTGRTADAKGSIKKRRCYEYQCICQ